MKTKYCPDCGQKVPIEMFGRDTSRASGYRTYCRVHRRIRDQKTRAKRAAHYAELKQTNSMLLSHNKELERQLKQCKRCYQMALRTLATIESRHRIERGKHE